MFTYQIFGNTSLLEKKTLDRIFLLLETHISISQKGTIDITYLCESEIQTINARHRNKDVPTDVLSFCYVSAEKNTDPTIPVGEIFLCTSIIAQQACDHSLSFTQESYRMIIHGLLHILGYDHETESEYILMYEKEKKILEGIGL